MAWISRIQWEASTGYGLGAYRTYEGHSRDGRPLARAG